ncbi:MAG: 50S ribosomal protein L11 methyltransferase, partial [Deltaproteobacteria bacterium]|nr:50S ribosomal protein L11 methyltransferase [Deltaproteobacteria bacterium]
SEPYNPAPDAVFKAYLPLYSEGKVARLEKDLSRLGWTLCYAPFKDRDWAEKWKAGLRPVRVSRAGASVLVKPSWSRATKRPGEKVIEIDPGMAFGTGGHETTKMCLKAMLRLLTDKRLKGLRSSFLDVGTGTGVLAIAAKKLGVKKAVGTDIDKVALKVARKNAIANRAKITLTGLPASRVRGSFPLIAANILAGELTRLAPELCGKLREGGFLILSGILVEEGNAVADVYRNDGLRLARRYAAGEWTALVFQKPQG